MLLKLFKITWAFRVILLFRVAQKKNVIYHWARIKTYFPCVCVGCVFELSCLFGGKKEIRGSQWFCCHSFVRPSSHPFNQQICTRLSTVPGTEDAKVSRTGKTSILWELLQNSRILHRLLDYAFHHSLWVIIITYHFYKENLFKRGKNGILQ